MNIQQNQSRVKIQVLAKNNFLTMRRIDELKLLLLNSTRPYKSVLKQYNNPWLMRLVTW